MGARGLSSPESWEKEDLAPQIPKVAHNFFRWSDNTESELTGSAVAIDVKKRCPKNKNVKNAIFVKRIKNVKTVE